jgi:hypothetical protein
MYLLSSFKFFNFYGRIWIHGEQLLFVSLHQLVGVIIAQRNQGKKSNPHELTNPSFNPNHSILTPYSKFLLACVRTTENANHETLGMSGCGRRWKFEENDRTEYLTPVTLAERARYSL